MSFACESGKSSLSSIAARIFVAASGVSPGCSLSKLGHNRESSSAMMFSIPGTNLKYNRIAGWQATTSKPFDLSHSSGTEGLRDQ
jgi:hypothetical protein